MTMTHKEALCVAAEKSIGRAGSTCVEDDIEVAIRAYADALDVVLVPREPTDGMHNAARDWSYAKYGKPIGFDASKGCWYAMLAAAPDPFAQEEQA